MTIKVSKNSFAGHRHLFGKNGLGDTIKNIVIQSARIRLGDQSANVFTDNSTGTNTVQQSLVIPSAAINVVAGNLGATLSALNAALGRVSNADKVMGDYVNLVRAKLGLTALTISAGTAAVAGTIPAQDKTVAGANSTAVADFASSVTQLSVAKSNWLILLEAANECLVALGKPAVALANVSSISFTMPAIGTVSASAGTLGLSVVDANAFLLAHANNVANLAASWNTNMGVNFATAPALVIAG